MTVEPKHDLDHVIDQTLASMMSGEPQRVDAASVRAAIQPTRQPRLPFWLAAAAVLVVGIAISFRDRGSMVESPNPTAYRAAPSTATERELDSSLDPIPTESRTFRVASHKPRVEAASSDTPYEGLPRLTIAFIDLPEPLLAGRLEAPAIQIARIDIAPLSVSSLLNEQEH